MSTQKSRSLWSDGWARLLRNRAAVVSLIFIIFILLIAVTAKWIAPYPFDEQNISQQLQSPSGEHFFGTDKLGRDLFSRVIYGARVSMAVALMSAIVCLVIGALYGSLAGWVGGRLEALMMRFIDILLGIPQLVLMILVKVLFDSVELFSDAEVRAVVGTTLALSVDGWVTMARLVRGQVIQARQMLYVESARALGAGPFSIMFRHIWPNILGPVIVMLTFQIPSNILYESFLSFIGLGLKPPYSSWGVLANAGFEVIDTFPHLLIFPGLAIFMTMLAFNLLGDGLRDAFDPQMRGRMDT